MEIIRVSPVSGNTNTMDLPVTSEQLERWRSGEKIQRVMPNLTADQREFIMTGITSKEWNETFKDE